MRSLLARVVREKQITPWRVGPRGLLIRNVSACEAGLARRTEGWPPWPRPAAAMSAENTHGNLGRDLSNPGLLVRLMDKKETRCRLPIQRSECHEKTQRGVCFILDQSAAAGGAGFRSAPHQLHGLIAALLSRGAIDVAMASLAGRAPWHFAYRPDVPGSTQVIRGTTARRHARGTTS